MQELKIEEAKQRLTNCNVTQEIIVCCYTINAGVRY